MAHAASLRGRSHRNRVRESAGGGSRLGPGRASLSRDIALARCVSRCRMTPPGIWTWTSSDVSPAPPRPGQSVAGLSRPRVGRATRQRAELFIVTPARPDRGTLQLAGETSRLATFRRGDPWSSPSEPRTRQLGLGRATRAYLGLPQSPGAPLSMSICCASSSTSCHSRSAAWHSSARKRCSATPSSASCMAPAESRRDEVGQLSFRRGVHGLTVNTASGIDRAPTRDRSTPVTTEMRLDQRARERMAVARWKTTGLRRSGRRSAYRYHAPAVDECYAAVHRS